MGVGGPGISTGSAGCTGGIGGKVLTALVASVGCMLVMVEVDRCWGLRTQGVSWAI